MNNSEPMIGHNQPPSPLDDAIYTALNLSAYLADNPVILTEDDAVTAKGVYDYGRDALATLEKERKSESQPLHDAWKACLAKFAPHVDGISRLMTELKSRMTAFALAEEARRQKALADARAIAAKAEAAAREAERLEAEAKEDASLGDLGADVGTSIQKADDAFQEYIDADKAAYDASRAAKDTVIRGGFLRGVGLKNKPVLTVSNAQAALTDIGLTDDISEAIIKSARLWRKLHGRWPNGITETFERTL